MRLRSLLVRLLFSSNSALILLVLATASQARSDSAIRINAGGAAYTDSSGNLWSADQNYRSGNTFSTSNSINNTSDPTLYQTERYGNMAYNVSVPNGTYNVTLKFAELYWNRATSRVFNVFINNQQVLSNFDIFASAGGQYVGIDESFPVSVSSGVISITFGSVVDNPKVDAIQIVPQGSSTVGLPTSAFALRIHAGGGDYTDSSGNLWSADENYQGGATYSTGQSIENTPDSTLYQTERYGNMQYSQKVPNGSYVVTLKFAELYWNGAGSRVFNAFINDQQVLSNFDIFASAGGQYRGLDKSFPITVSGGTINIAFSGIVDNPKVDAIQIVQSGSVAGIQASSASTFLGSLGVNIHAAQGYNANNYISPIQYLGIRNIRDGAAGAYSSYMLHQKTGILADLVLGCDQFGADSNNVLPSIVQYVSSKGALLSLEGANEPNNFPITYNGQQGGGICASCTWVPVAQCQRDLYSAVKGNASLSQYPVLTVTEGGAETDNVGLQFLTIPSGAGTLMPAGTRYGDYANMHNYVSGNSSGLYEDNQAWLAADTQQNSFPGDILYNEYGSTWLEQYPGYSASQLQTLPRIASETGWDSVGNPGGEPVQGKVLTNAYLAQFKRGWAYTFIYELIDGEGSSTTQGLFHSDYTPKLAATYIHNLTAILADTGSLASAGTVNYSIANQPATVHDLLLQKSNGSFELVIWDERANASDTITINLGATYSAVNAYDITSGTSPVQTFSNVTSIPLTLTDHAVVLEFK